MSARRRGAELERALLEAAWGEFTRHGYSGFTLAGVARRAGTSRPVIARRWHDRAELAIAAIRHQMSKHPMAVADRGDVRTELLMYLARASERVTGIAAVFSLFSSEYFCQTESTPEDLRAALSADSDDTLRRILARAVERGEIDADKLIPAVATLLDDLLQRHAIVTFSAPSESLRTTWVDAIFLPLVRPA